jgi:anti-sigma B factor antagonist
MDDTTDAAFTVEATSDPDGGPVLVVHGDVDLLTAPQLEEHLTAVVDDDITTLVLDLAHVGFIDSSGVRAIITGHRALEQRSIALVLRSPSTAARRLLELTGLDGVLTIEET